MVRRRWSTREFSFDTADAVSVVGTFNAWDPRAGVMVVGANGARQWAVHLRPGRYAFRYLDMHGQFFDDSEADFYDPNGFGQCHGVMIVDGGAVDGAGAVAAQLAIPSENARHSPARIGASRLPWRFAFAVVHVGVWEMLTAACACGCRRVPVKSSLLWIVAAGLVGPGGYSLFERQR